MAKEKDADVIANLYDDGLSSGHFEKIHPNLDSKTVFINLIRNRSVRIKYKAIGVVDLDLDIFVGTNSGVVCGFFANKPWLSDRQLIGYELWMLAISPEYRGTDDKVGSKFLDQQIKSAIWRGKGAALYSRCNVKNSAAAINMLLRRGFIRDEFAEVDDRFISLVRHNT